VAEPEPAAEAQGRQDLRGSGTVLVVDDEGMIRNFAKSALESQGYKVLLAADGQEAVRVFREKSAEIGLVLLDVAMPGMDGVATLERIRETGPPRSRADMQRIRRFGPGEAVCEEPDRRPSSPNRSP